MIPKQFQWVWLGPNALPPKDQKWMRSWGEKHPDWRCIVWAEHPENITLEGFEVKPLPPLINRKFYDGIEQWVTGRAALAARSDVVRYELVARYGGVYLDTDVECFAAIDEVLCGVNLFVADEWGPSAGNYMFGASPNHPALWTVVRELGPHLSGHKTALNAVQAAGPTYLNSRLRQYPDLVIFPHMLFNPLCAYDDPAQVTQWPACSLANHHYDGKWYDRVKNKPPEEFRKKVATHGLSTATKAAKGTTGQPDKAGDLARSTHQPSDSVSASALLRPHEGNSTAVLSRFGGATGK